MQKHKENMDTGRSIPKSSSPFFQPKLTVNTPGDAYEQEADQVADQVMRMGEGDAPIVQRMALSSVGGVQRQCAACASEDQEEQLHRKETGGGDASGKAAPPIVSDVLSSGGGQPMDGGTRQHMESRFGQDFGQVRIHTDSRAAQSADAIQARAYTSGNNIVFRQGEYQPATSEGQRLLAHELVHVGQQGGGAGSGYTDTVSRKPVKGKAASKTPTKKASKKKSTPKSATEHGDSKTCKQEYSTKKELVEDRSILNQRLDININSWDAFITNEVEHVVDETFTSEEALISTAELTDIGVDLLGLTTLVSPAGIFAAILVKSFAIVSEHLEAQREANTLEEKKHEIARTSIEVMLIDSENKKKEGNDLIERRLAEAKQNDSDGCADVFLNIEAEINSIYPQISTALYTQIKQIVRETVDRAILISSYPAMVEARESEYNACLTKHGPSAAIDGPNPAFEKCYYLTFPYPEETRAKALVDQVRGTGHNSP